jgi:hypothetical protein
VEEVGVVAEGAAEMAVESSGTGEGASIMGLGDVAQQGDKENGGETRQEGEKEVVVQKRGRVKETPKKD